MWATQVAIELSAPPGGWSEAHQRRLTLWREPSQSGRKGWLTILALQRSGPNNSAVESAQGVELPLYA
jgi:hypothetical protein